MAEEKELPPTEQRIKKAREEGQVATSQDLMRSAVCLSVFEGTRALFLTYHDFAAVYFQEYVGQLALLREGHRFNAENVFVWIAVSVGATMALASVAAVIWIATSWAQTQGPVFKKTPIEFKLDKFNPSKFFSNIFSAKTLIDLGGNIVKLIVIVIFFVQAVRHVFHEAPLYVPGGMEAVTSMIGRELVSAIRTTLAALFCLAVLDFGVQRWLTMRSLKMSMEEMKKEMKENNGNPEIKGHIRQLGQELQNEGPAHDPLEDSNALIVNPTHLAVGLRYRRGDKQLPQIRVKGADQAATSLIETARERNVPVVRHIWLARTLFEHPEGSPIPREAFKAVAAVYRMLFQLEEAFKAEQAKSAESKAYAADLQAAATTAEGVQEQTPADRDAESEARVQDRRAPNLGY